MNTVNLSTGGPPETVLPSPPDELMSALEKALALEDQLQQRDAVSSVVAAAPLFLEAWARLGDLARDPVEAYAAYRVGYHRGLDQLRQNGWRGTGYVRWAHFSNRGFLRALDGLRRMAEVIGEQAEAERCAQFLAQLDPAWDPAQVDRPTE
jgi:hypothetical protein